MTFKINIYLIFVYFFLVTNLNAQNLGLYFTGSCPQKSLQNLGYKNGLGFSLEYLSNQLIKKESFSLRLSIGFDAQWHGNKILILLLLILRITINDIHVLKIHV